MLNKISKLILFYFAYLPLFVILVINKIDMYEQIIMISLLLIIIGYILVTALLKTINNVVSNREKITIHELKNSEYIGFLLSFIFPFLIDFSEIKQIISFVLLILIICYLYLETSLFCVNPLLKLFFGYNIYDVSIKDKKYFLLSKTDYMNEEADINIKKLERNVLIEDK